MKYYILYFLSALTSLTVVLAASSEEVTCDKCVRREECEIFQYMDPGKQNAWISKYPCTQGAMYVCCSTRLWDNEVDNYYEDYLDSTYPIYGEPIKTPKTLHLHDATNSGQCAVSSIPVDPNTQCCGKEASEAERMNAATSTESPVQPTLFDETRFKRSSANADIPTVEANRTDNDSLSIRITGGQETSLYQFPWTVHLVMSFVPDPQMKGLCGGSLISSRYVLTAAHCVYNPNRTLTNVDVYLAEYDTSTFPRDCKKELNYGLQCVDNVVIPAEGVTWNALYDTVMIHNDIALIRLQQIAPYTTFIKPICLPPLDIDDADLANMPLVVTGWGLNGYKTSNTKQSTVLSLVPQEQCKKYYPDLFRGQLCVIGYNGEDTCSGDSGGPLMMLYEGQYYVVGLVSGKRSDAPCGTAVPTLFTNVYNYLPWIYANIKN